MEEVPNTRLLRKSSFQIPSTPQKLSRTRSVRKNTYTEKLTVAETSDVTKEVKDLENSFQDKISLKCLTEKYFSQHSEKNKILSKKTLANLGNDRLTTDQATKLLTKIPKPICIKEIEIRLREIEDMFPRMIVQLKNGYNILIYGAGSKLQLLESFVKKYLTETNCIVVPGFQTNIAMIQVLYTIMESYSIKIQSSCKSLSSLANSIKDFYNDQSLKELFLIFHNIEGPGLVNSLEAITILGQCQNIHILASVDHINSDRIWPQNSPNWLWYDCTTCLPYSCETMAGNSRLMAANSGTGLDSLRAVTASLHDNAKQIFLLLAKYQIEHQNQKYEGMLVETLLRQSRDSFFVASELALRNLLLEFKDHKLIQFKFGYDRSEYVKIILDSDSIQKFITNFKDF